MSWGGVQALAGVDLQIPRGEILGLAGPNGAGKSTLLNAIGGQIKPRGGQLYLGDQSLLGTSPNQRRRMGIGRTFQSIRVFSEKSVLINIALAIQYAKSSRWFPPLRFSGETEKLAHEAMELVGLRVPPDALAGALGVYAQKLVMLAMAVVPAPALLLLDEPAGGLSPEEVDEHAVLITRLRDLGMTIVLVDHVMTFLTQVADRLAFLHEGRILREGTPEAVAGDPLVRETWLGGHV
jgi:ABC-type branched-subunit amino acid transport system ATPase component